MNIENLKRKKRNKSFHLDSMEPSNPNIDLTLTPQKLPYIYTRLKSYETLFPHADGPCKSMTERRLKLYYHYLNSSNVLRWGNLEKRMINLIGSTHRRIGWLTWLNILDVFTSFQAHNISFPIGKKYAVYK